MLDYDEIEDDEQHFEELDEMVEVELEMGLDEMVVQYDNLDNLEVIIQVDDEVEDDEVDVKADEVCLK